MLRAIPQATWHGQSQAETQGEKGKSHLKQHSTHHTQPFFDVSTMPCHTVAATSNLAKSQALDESYLGPSRSLSDMLRLMLQLWLLRWVATSLTLNSSTSNMNIATHHMTAALHNADEQQDCICIGSVTYHELLHLCHGYGLPGRILVGAYEVGINCAKLQACRESCPE